MPVIEAMGTAIEKAAGAASTAGKVETVSKDVHEFSDKALEHPSAKNFLTSKLDEVKFSTPEQLEATMDENLEMCDNGESCADHEKVNSKEGLTDEEKARLKEETGWSDEIIDNIGSMEEAEIYKKAGLIEARIGDRTCLIRPDIDWEQKDQFGRTNAERVKQKLVPLNKDGQQIELHHIGQHDDSPLAELTTQEHRGKGNDSIMHDKTKESEIDRTAFNNERVEHWNERVEAEGVKSNE